MNEYKYIGIRGHRGSGKNTIAFLLAHTIQYLLDLKRAVTTEDLLKFNEDFNSQWNTWCNDIIADEREAMNEISTSNVYLDSFGYTPKFLVELLTGIPHEYINSDYYKDHILIQIKDFSWKVVENEEELKTWTPSAKELISYVDQERGLERDSNIDQLNNTATRMKLRDFIVYFATVCMKYLGRNVWIKAMRCSDEKYQEYEDIYNIGPKFKILTDVKTPSELEYVKQKDGLIIKVSRPENEKANKGVSQLENDNRYDFSIYNTDIINDIEFRRNLIDIAQVIIS